jgi:hypothetical protein
VGVGACASVLPFSLFESLFPSLPFYNSFAVVDRTRAHLISASRCAAAVTTRLACAIGTGLDIGGGRGRRVGLCPFGGWGEGGGMCSRALFAFAADLWTRLVVASTAGCVVSPHHHMRTNCTVRGYEKFETRAQGVRAKRDERDARCAEKLVRKCCVVYNMKRTAGHSC